MDAYPKVLSSPVQTVVIRSKSYSTSSTILTSSFSQPFTPPPLPRPQSLRLQGTELPPHLPLCPRYRCSSGYKTASWPAQGQTILGPAENVAKKRPVVLRRLKGSHQVLVRDKTPGCVAGEKNCTRFHAACCIACWLTMCCVMSC